MDVHHVEQRGGARWQDGQRSPPSRPSAGNHGPVRVRYATHFGYEDGTPYVPIGTTGYAWTHQGDRLEEQTLATLRARALQ